MPKKAVGVKAWFITGHIVMDFYEVIEMIERQESSIIVIFRCNLEILEWFDDEKVRIQDFPISHPKMLSREFYTTQDETHNYIQYHFS